MCALLFALAQKLYFYKYVRVGCHYPLLFWKFCFNCDRALWGYRDELVGGGVEDRRVQGEGQRIEKLSG